MGAVQMVFTEPVEDLSSRHVIDGVAKILLEHAGDDPEEMLTSFAPTLVGAAKDKEER